MSIRLAVVQPLAHPPPNDERNVEDAVRQIETAAEQGADLVAFPETYPGPWRMPVTFDPTPALVDAAVRCGVYVQYGTLEPIDENAGTAYNVLLLADPAGGEPGRYRRTHPPGPWIYSAGDLWRFQYVAADEFPVFPTELGVLGLAMCSEVYVPEVCRALALRGAELILLPAGTDKRQLWSSWRHLIWARAIENLAFVATTQNVFSANERGLAMVASPEEVIFEATGPGQFIVEIDLECVRELRAGNDRSESNDRVKTGLLEQWLRPELYGRFTGSSESSSDRRG